jgi:hypothetical protein
VSAYGHAACEIKNDFYCNEGLANGRLAGCLAVSTRDIKDGQTDVRYGNGYGLHFCDNTHIRFMNTIPMSLRRPSGKTDTKMLSRANLTFIIESMRVSPCSLGGLRTDTFLSIWVLGDQANL